MILCDSDAPSSRLEGGTAQRSSPTEREGGTGLLDRPPHRKGGGKAASSAARRPPHPRTGWPPAPTSAPAPGNGRTGRPRSPPPGDWPRCSFPTQRLGRQTTSLIAVPACPVRLRGEEGGDCGGSSRAAPHGKCSPGRRAGRALLAAENYVSQKAPLGGHSRLATPPGRAPPGPFPPLLPQRGGSGTFATGRHEPQVTAAAQCNAASRSAMQCKRSVVRCGAAPSTPRSECGTGRSTRSARAAARRAEGPAAELRGGRECSRFPARPAAGTAAGRCLVCGGRAGAGAAGAGAAVSPASASVAPACSAGRWFAPARHLLPVIYSLWAGESGTVFLSRA